MPRALKINALISCVLALLFSIFLMYLKHDPALSPIAPFVEDPYDAVGSFADEAVLFLSLLALYRAFRPYGTKAACASQKSSLVRTELAVPLAILLTVGSNGVGMARHFGLWAGAPAATLLFSLQAGMATTALLVGALIWLRARRSMANVRRNHRTEALLVLLAAILLLALYPEDLRASVPGALLSVEVGALVLFASLWALGTTLLPDASTEPISVRPARAASWWHGIQWGVVVVLAALIGLLLVAAELTEGAGGPTQLPRLAFIASVYVGLEVVGVMIGFAFLRRWLGLFQ